LFLRLAQFQISSKTPNLDPEKKKREREGERERRNKKGNGRTYAG